MTSNFGLLIRDQYIIAKLWKFCLKSNVALGIFVYDH